MPFLQLEKNVKKITAEIEQAWSSLMMVIDTGPVEDEMIKILKKLVSREITKLKREKIERLKLEKPDRAARKQIAKAQRARWKRIKAA